MLPKKHRTSIDRRHALGIGAKTLATCSMGCCAIWGCSSAPITGRNRVVLTPENQEIQLGIQAFQDTLSNEQLSTNAEAGRIVERVGQRIANVANREDYQWEFKLIASATQNAFALPGGKVAMYEGLLPVCRHEAGLAVVMAHEVGHAIARHGGERMTQNMAADFGKRMVDRLTSSRFPEKSQQIALYYGALSKYGVLLPFSRKHEAEADHIGIVLMAKAGYDPQAAPEFWRRFGAVKQGEQTPEWMSTHPADTRRASNLMMLMEEAQGEYARSPQKLGFGEGLVNV